MKRMKFMEVLALVLAMLLTPLVYATSTLTPDDTHYAASFFSDTDAMIAFDLLSASDPGPGGDYDADGAMSPDNDTIADTSLTAPRRSLAAGKDRSFYRDGTAVAWEQPEYRIRLRYAQTSGGPPVFASGKC